VDARSEEHRPRSWGADWPSDEDEARERLLAAADACHAEKGTLLAASFVRVLAATAEAVDQCWQTDDPFVTQLVAACLRGTDIARSSPIMRSLMEEHQALGVAYHAAERSELWRAKLADTLVRRLEAAAAAGEIRCDLAADTLARWIVRINFSLIAEPARSEDGGDEALLRNLLLASLDPCAQRGGRAETDVD
jgi:hypothetical protein